LGRSVAVRLDIEIESEKKAGAEQRSPDDPACMYSPPEFGAAMVRSYHQN